MGCVETNILNQHMDLQLVAIFSTPGKGGCMTKFQNMLQGFFCHQPLIVKKKKK